MDALRSVAGDKTSHAATRNMACCAVTGQGAGIAAAMSLKSNKELARLLRKMRPRGT